MRRFRLAKLVPPALAAPKLVLLALAAPLLLGGCISVTRETPPPTSTVVVPQGSTAICSNGTQPPC